MKAPSSLNHMMESQHNHSANLQHVENDELEAKLKAAPGLVLVDFWATWCGPCQILGPLLEKLAVDHPEVTVLKVDVDQNQRTAAQYQVFSIPTVQFFSKGIAIGEPIVGAQRPHVYETAIAAFSAPPAEAA